MTKDDGTYSIPWSGGDAAGLVVITETLPTTKDSDDEGKTFDEVGKKSFTLAAPVPVGATTDIKITPLTTMITIDALPQDTGVTKRLDATSVSNASTALNISLGMDAAKDLLKLDVTKDASARPIAQLVSHKLGGIQSTATGGMSAEKMKSAVVNAKNSTVGMLDDTGALPASVTTALAKPPAERVAALNQNSKIAGTISSAALVIHQGSSNFDVKQALKNGVVISNFDSGYNPLDATKEGGIGDWKQGDYFNVTFLKFDADGKFGSEVRRVLDGTWVKDADWGRDFFLGAKGEWVKENTFSEPDHSLTFSGNCAISKMSALLAHSSQFCFSGKDLDGLVISKLNTSYCDQKADGGKPDQTLCKEAKFKTGSKGYEVTLSTVDADEYRINVPNRESDLKYHYGNSWNNSSEATSINEFIDAFNKKSSDTSYMLSIWDNFAISIKSYDEKKSAGVFNWFNNENGKKPAGEGSFEIKNVNGATVLVFKPSNEYHKRRPGKMVGQDFVFAAKDKRIRLGTVTYKDVKQQFNLTGYNWFGNKEFLESILEGLKFNNQSLPAFPFDDK